MHAMIVARECLPGAPVYFSSQTHYSIPKSAVFYRMDACPVETRRTGEIDIADFRRKLQANKEKGIYTAIVNVNCGTTVRGGIDNLDEVVAVLDEVIGHREQYHIHVDGALFAQILPHLDKEGSVPILDFTRPIASLSVSGHKMMGCPMPSGVVVHRKENIKRIEKRVEYLNSFDTTIMGSRNGQSPLFMWLSIQKKGLKGFQEDAAKCIENSKYIYNKFIDAGLEAMLNDYSNTLVFPRPTDDALIQKWQLACTLTEGHICVMPSTSTGKLDEFFEDYVKHIAAQKN
jgi:histidine decarboxylase